MRQYWATYLYRIKVLRIDLHDTLPNLMNSEAEKYNDNYERW